MKHLIIGWIHMSKLRSEFFRDAVAKTFENIEKYSFGYRNGAAEMQKKSPEFEKNGKKGGKIFQLEHFLTDEYTNSLQAYGVNFLMKEWIVFQTDTEEFLTSDNPGFSSTWSHLNEVLKIPPVMGDYNLSENGYVSHYFPLASDMCLFLRPYAWSDDTPSSRLSKTRNATSYL